MVKLNVSLRTRFAIAGGITLVAGVYSYLSRPGSTETIPKKQKSIVLVEPNANLDDVKIAVKETDVPQPRSGEVLVKMVAAPVNPSDFGSWKTGPSNRVMGSEGCGVVVASGGGVVAGRLLGMRVGVAAGVGVAGTYQQYVCVNASKAWKLDQNSPTEDGASFLVNPYTAVGIIDTVKSHGQKVFIHTAAASQLGQMLVKIAPSLGVTIVNLVRRDEQAEILKKLGAQYVVVEKEGWEKELKELVERFKIKVAFDAISGDMVGTLVDMLLPGGTAYVYARLSEKPVGNITAIDLIYKGKQVKGWFLGTWMKGGGMIKTLLRIRNATSLVNPGLSGGWSSSSFSDCSMDEMWPKFAAMRADRGSGGFTGRKLRIRF